MNPEPVNGYKKGYHSWQSRSTKTSTSQQFELRHKRKTVEKYPILAAQVK
jgi:hypothetical protein